MLIKKIEKQNDQGQLEVTFALTEAQTQMLLEFAINFFLSRGLISYSSDSVIVEKEVNTEENIERAAGEYMAQAKPSDLPQA